jgi:hypothetical protein
MPAQQVRILPGALEFLQVSDGFQMSADWSQLFWSVLWSVIGWHQMAQPGPR